MTIIRILYTILSAVQILSLPCYLVYLAGVFPGQPKVQVGVTATGVSTMTIIRILYTILSAVQILSLPCYLVYLAGVFPGQPKVQVGVTATGVST